ncbi:hypothetical protein XELAEV_18042341mg [Xenopus laevis]|uniref:Uncharacterized protein n=1 Tax=Xenopus laevis TaxID=8355 RepID=A0A974C449_XENLA|nr:hypothetical protein XELAEV_18042341mg [Xenopus laevis]
MQLDKDSYAFCKHVHHSSSSLKVFCLNRNFKRLTNSFKSNSTALSVSFHNRIADSLWHRAVFAFLS